MAQQVSYLVQYDTFSNRHAMVCRSLDFAAVAADNGYVVRGILHGGRELCGLNRRRQTGLEWQKQHHHDGQELCMATSPPRINVPGF